MPEAQFLEARKAFHAALLEATLTTKLRDKMDDLTLEDKIGWWSNSCSNGSRTKHFYEYSPLSEKHRATICGRKHHVGQLSHPVEGDKTCVFCARKADL